MEQQDVFYYVTMMNENYAQPSLPAGLEQEVLRGCYHFKSYSHDKCEGQNPISLKNVTLLGSGAILGEVIKAAQQLTSQGIDVTVFSITSWSELARDGMVCEQCALAGQAEPGVSFLTQQLQASLGPAIAASDYVRAVPESVRAFLPAGRDFLTLGTDGFGRSDTRAALRGFFGVDAASVVRAARHVLRVN